MPPVEPDRGCERGAATAWRGLFGRLGNGRRRRPRRHDAGHDAAGGPELSESPTGVRSRRLRAAGERRRGRRGSPGGRCTGLECGVGHPGPGWRAGVGWFHGPGRRRGPPRPGRGDSGGGRQASRRTRDRGLRAGHRRDTARSPPGRLADVPAHLRRPGPQPARSGRRGQRRRAAAGLVLGDGGRREPADAAGLPRSDVSRQPAQHHPGAGGRHWHADLGVPPFAGGRCGARVQPAPQPRDLGRQGLRRHQGRGDARARRPERTAGVGDPDRRSGKGLPEHERTDRRTGHPRRGRSRRGGARNRRKKRTRDQRDQRLHPLLRGQLLHHRPRCGNR